MNVELAHDPERPRRLVGAARCVVVTLLRGAMLAAAPRNASEGSP